VLLRVMESFAMCAPLAIPAVPPETVSPPAATHPLLVSKVVAHPAKYSVFVSYSSRDDPAVTALIRLLAATGASAFKDTQSIMPGDAWREIVFAGIRDAETTLVFWSSNSSTSEEVEKEWKLALDLGKRVIPVVLDSTPLPPDLEEIQAIDLRAVVKPPLTPHGETLSGGQLLLATDATRISTSLHRLLERIFDEY
jgi:TIR domain